MQSIEIEFCHPIKREETFKLSWTLIDNDASFLWFKLFCKNLKSRNKFFTRFSGFGEGEDHLDYLITSLNNCIDIINRDGRYLIKERARKNFTQEFANIIHHHFEILSGDSDNPTEFTVNCSLEVLNAMNGLNYFIHDLVAFSRNQNCNAKGDLSSVFSSVVVEVKYCKRFIIPESFNNYFSLNIEFGDLVAHYSQIGKTWLEVFQENDIEILQDAIRPLYAFSGELDVMFGEFIPSQEFNNNLKRFLERRKLDINNKSLRLGFLPIAKFDRNNGLSDNEYHKLLSYFNDIKSLNAINDGKLIVEKKLENSTKI